MPQIFIQASKKSFRSLIATLKILYWKEHWPEKQETWILAWNPPSTFKQASLSKHLWVPGFSLFLCKVRLIISASYNEVMTYF